MTVVTPLVAFTALILGALIGWLFAGRQAGALKAERDGLSERFKAAVTDLAAEAEARKAADLQLPRCLRNKRRATRRTTRRSRSFARRRAR